MPINKSYNWLLLLLLPWTLQAQRLPKPDLLGMEDGLSIRDVKAIAQDARGLMWFGTTQGIERYDGQFFLKYSSDSQADFHFLGSHVSDENMLIVNDSSLWVLADGELYSLNLRTQKSTNLSAAAGLTKKVYTLRQGADSTIWIATSDDQKQHLMRYIGNHQFQEVATAKYFRMPFNDIAIDNKGNAWWSTNMEGLRLFSPNGDLLHSAKPDSIDWFDTKIYFTNISTDSRGRLFIFPKSDSAIWLYHPETRQYDVLAENLSHRVYTMLEDAYDNFWFATFDGLLRWNPSGEWTDYSALLHSSLQFSNIHQLYEDRTHLLWISTDNGLLRFPIGRDMFQNYLTVPEADWGNAMRGIISINADEVLAYVEKGQTGFHLINISQQKAQLVYPFNDSSIIVPATYQFDNIILDKKENVAWAVNDKLLKINLEDIEGTIEADFTGISSKWSRKPLCQLEDGTLVLGIDIDKLTLYNPRNRHRQGLFTNGTENLPKIKNLVIAEGPDGSIWVGTEVGGLYCFNRKGETLAHFSTKTSPAISKDFVLSLLFDKTGKLWVGTFGGGLCLIDFPSFENLESLSAKIHTFTQKDGLCDNNVVSILEDDLGNIWAGTYNGLSCYLVSEGTFRNFYEEDGLSNNEFNYASSFKDENGGLWFGGMNGVNYFNPKNILQAERNPALCLTRFTKYNSKTDSVLSQIIENEIINRFVISPNDSWFQFSWALPNYLKPDKNQYYVQLEGIDGDWNYIGNSPYVRYNKLPAGDYTLRVKASDSKGIWSEAELAIPITVLPFFYQTWWFYLLVLTAVAGIGYAISRYRLQRLLEMERMRTRIASDLHDEVGSMLSGLSMQSELLEMNASEKDRPRIERIGDISRTAVSKMRDLVWSIDSRRDKVKNLLERMQEQTADLLQPRDISFRFELGDLPLEKKLPVDLRQHLFLIFKEALTNIFRHSNASAVTIRFGNFGGQFEMSIHDNGSSLIKDKISTGMGLSNMDMRAGKLKAKLEIATNEGFAIKLSMPPL